LRNESLAGRADILEGDAFPSSLRQWSSPLNRVARSDV
jgi:hypothetical protein